MVHLKIGELLIQQGLITEDQLKEAMKAQKKESGRIGEVLMKLGILSEEELAKALGAQLNIPHATLENNLLQPDLNQGLDKIIPYDFAKANSIESKALFIDVYHCLIGKERGPRLGKLIAALGLERGKNDLGI